MEKIQQLEKELIRLDHPEFAPRDTVKVHVKAILRKLEVRNRTQAAIWASTRGFSNYRATSQDRTDSSQS